MIDDPQIGERVSLGVGPNVSDWLAFLQRRASEVVYRWAAENPAYLPKPEDTKRFLDKLSDSGWREEAVNKSKNLVKDVTFTYPWGKLTEH